MVITRCLMWAHYLYLLSLPATASFWAGIEGYSDGFRLSLVFGGLLSVFAYTMFLANGYTLPARLPAALAVVLAVPAQIALSVFIFGGRSLWLFFIEGAAVEVGAFLPGILMAKLRHEPEQRRTVYFFTALVLTGIAPFFILVFDGYGGASLWLALFITSYVTAFKEYRLLYAKAIADYARRGGQAQEIEMRYDGGPMAKFLGIDTGVKMIGPFYKRRKESSDWRAVVFGLAFFVLFIIGQGIGDIFAE